MMPAIYGNAYEIVQGPGYVSILYEMIHEARVIPLDSRPHASSKIKLFMGDARAHFDGSTLVVETTNFDERSAHRGATSSLKLVERFTRVAPDVVEWAVTADDARTWTRPWTFTMNLTKKDDSQRPFEYACHEGNTACTTSSAPRARKNETRPRAAARSRGRQRRERRSIRARLPRRGRSWNLEVRT
jgi:hypothetical protein